jgi:hypothetical protein
MIVFNAAHSMELARWNRYSGNGGITFPHLRKSESYGNIAAKAEGYSLESHETQY